MYLKSFDAKSKLKVIREIKKLLTLGLKDAKELVEKAPILIKEGISKEESDSLADKLQKIKCEIEIK